MAVPNRKENPSEPMALPVSATMSVENASKMLKQFDIGDEKLVCWKSFFRGFSHGLYLLEDPLKPEQRMFRNGYLKFLREFTRAASDEAQIGAIPVFCSPEAREVSQRLEAMLTLQDQNDRVFLKASDVLNLILAHTGCTSLDDKSHPYYNAMVAGVNILAASVSYVPAWENGSMRAATKVDWSKKTNETQIYNPYFTGKFGGARKSI